MKPNYSISRRTFCAGAAGVAACGAAIGRAAESNVIPVGTPVLTSPRIVGPIPVSPTSMPYSTSTTPGSFIARMMQEYDYVEEEYFLFGHANIYGPGIRKGPENTLAQVEELRPLGGLAKPQMPYATRLLLVRPRDNTKFSGRVLAYTFHNLNTTMKVEPPDAA